MKIVGFTQLRNELSKGNLENWFKQMSVCDYIYVFDQNSDDGSLEYYKQFENCVVIESPTNRFNEELVCKKELLEKLLSEHPDTDWILWLDGDLLLDGRLLKNNGEELKNMCQLGTNYEIDGFFFNHYNLWRSDIHYRIDDSYHSLNGGWCPLWRNNGKLNFLPLSGLHLPQYPSGIQKVSKTDYSVVHRGFATDYQIITKYNVYKSNGQNGWKLERLLNEMTLKVEELDKNLLPDWFIITDDINPKNKKLIREIYNENNGLITNQKKEIEVISLIFKSEDYLNLIHNEMKSKKSNVFGWDVKFRIVANDATEEIIEKLKSLDIPYSIYNDPNPNDYYLNRVYRCWNFAGKTSQYNNICFVNSDMVFSDGWLSNLLKHHDGKNIPCSRLVESGKLLSGQHAISYNCGKTPNEIDYKKWHDVVDRLTNESIQNGGLFMPCIFETKKFIEFGMYPEGNIYRDGVGTLNGFVQSGDDWFFKKLERDYGMKHITVFDSLVYHIQEGEKDS
jgi:hypothetical protein